MVFNGFVFQKGCILVLKESAEGLPKGTRLVLEDVTRSHLNCRTVETNQCVDLERVKRFLSPSTKSPSKMNSKPQGIQSVMQFPVSLGFSSTIHSCQTIQFDHLGLFKIDKPFEHGMVYSALSRATGRDAWKIVAEGSVITNKVENSLLWLLFYLIIRLFIIIPSSSIHTTHTSESSITDLSSKKHFQISMFTKCLLFSFRFVNPVHSFRWQPVYGPCPLWFETIPCPDLPSTIPTDCCLLSDSTLSYTRKLGIQSPLVPIQPLSNTVKHVFEEHAPLSLRHPKINLWIFENSV